MMYCLPAEVNYGTSEFLMYRALYCEDTLSGIQWLGLKLITHVHLDPRLTMCGAIPLLNYVPSQHAKYHLTFIINNTGQHSMKLISLQRLSLFYVPVSV